jgi:outer membrane protein assembly factor BamB
MTPLATLGLIFLLGSVQEDERRYVDEATDEFQRRWAAAESLRDWGQLLEMLAHERERRPHWLCQPEPDVARWIPLPRALSDRLFELLPDAAREAHETVAREVLEAVQERALRRTILERYAYTRVARQAREAMANRDFDEARVLEAIRGWTQALETKPGLELVARLGHAYRSMGDTTALTALRAQAERQGWKGEIRVGSQRVELREYLASLQPLSPASPSSPISEAPFLRGSRPGAPSSEVRLGYFDFRNEEGGSGRGLALSVPAAGRVGGQELVLLTSGNRILALDPSRGDGGTLEDAVEWRYPKEGGIRYRAPNPYGGIDTSHPSVGVTLSDGRAYATMYSAEVRQGAMGRRRDTFEGPAAIRAFDLATGELLWDTDTVEAPAAEGRRVRLIDQPPFEKRNFYFAGPPLARGPRLYAPVMMSPLSGRECWVAGLDAASGRVLWATHVASAPPTKQVPVASIAESEGTLVVLTNFGVIASLDPETGQFEWLVKYPTGQGRAAVSPPVIYRNLVYVLPSDSEEPFVYHRFSGREAAFPELSDDIPWRQIQQLVGRTEDWLVFAGQKNIAVRISDGRVVELAAGPCARVGRGTLTPGTLYLPTREGLEIFDTATWKLVSTARWAEGEDAGNVAVTDSLCVVLGDRLEVGTSFEELKRRFARKVDASPPRAEACRQLGRILEASGRPLESVGYYRRALSIWKDDPAWSESAEGLRKKLADLEEKLKDGFPKDD